jgi:hypothetical protein
MPKRKRSHSDPAPPLRKEPTFEWEDSFDTQKNGEPKSSQIRGDRGDQEFWITVHLWIYTTGWFWSCPALNVEREPLKAQTLNEAKVQALLKAREKTQKMLEQITFMIGKIFEDE